MTANFDNPTFFSSKWTWKADVRCVNSSEGIVSQYVLFLHWLSFRDQVFDVLSCSSASFHLVYFFLTQLKHLVMNWLDIIQPHLQVGEVCRFDMIDVEFFAVAKWNVSRSYSSVRFSIFNCFDSGVFRKCLRESRIKLNPRCFFFRGRSQLGCNRVELLELKDLFCVRCHKIITLTFGWFDLRDCLFPWDVVCVRKFLVRTPPCIGDGKVAQQKPEGE